MDIINKLAPTYAISEVKSDVLVFGSALIASRLLTGESLMDRQWQISSLLVLLGFAAYHLLTARILNSGSLLEGRLRTALDDVLKFGTMLVVSRLLSGGSITDTLWMKETAYVLIGFTIYNLVGYKALENSVINVNTLSPKVNAALSTAAKFVTMYAVSRYLSGGSFNREWMVESGGFALGASVATYLL